MHFCKLYFLQLDDDNRVVLLPIGDHSDCQRPFVNASYVDVRERHVLNKQLLCSFPLGIHLWQEILSSSRLLYY